MDRKGEYLGNYRKILMYETDKKYFSEGKERFVLNLKNLEGESFKVGGVDAVHGGHLHGH